MREKETIAYWEFRHPNKCHQKRIIQPLPIQLKFYPQENR